MGQLAWLRESCNTLLTGVPPGDKGSRDAMAYRRATRTRRSTRAARPVRRSTSARGRYSRKAKTGARRSAPKRKSAAKGLSSKQKQQVLRIVLTHEPVNPVERPAGAGSVVSAPRKARF
jgi:hypothetical protein